MKHELFNEIYSLLYIYFRLMSINYDKPYNTDMNVREEVKFMLLKRCITMTELAKRMSEITGKNYTQSLLSHKLSSESLKYNEMKLICKILGYRLHLEIDNITFTH